jgi:CDGSH iron-sulfur domain-containing protein 3
MDEQKHLSAEIILTKNEPIKITGTFEIKSYDGKLLSSEFDNEVYLCSCGRSKNKPFCDDSHKG